MNQRPTGLNVTKAITGFLQYKSAEGLSPVTVTGYDHDLKLWIEYQIVQGFFCKLDHTFPCYVS